MAAADPPKIFPLSESSLIVEFGSVISIKLNERAIALANHLDAHPFPGYIESVPCYASTAVFYDLLTVKREFPVVSIAFDAVQEVIKSVLPIIMLSTCRLLLNRPACRSRK